MTKALKIFFIGRRHGVIPFKARPWKLEKQRFGELDGFKAARGLVRTYSPARADVIFVRNMQEYTKQKDIENIEKRIGKFRADKLILNDIAYFRNYNSKDIAFAIWQKNGIPIPAFEVLDIKDSEQDLVKSVTDFLALHPCTILRTTNDEGGLGMFFLDSDMDQQQIVDKVRECRAYVTGNKGFRTDSGIMLVEYIGDCHSSGYQYLCRAYCIGPHIVSGRCVTGKVHNLHAKTMQADDFEEFVTMNATLVPRFNQEPFRSQILKAVDCLDIKMTAIDFLYQDGAIFFLEVNPMWGGGYSYGNESFMSLLKQNRSDLKKRIPNIYQLLDGVPFYRSLYETIGEYAGEYYAGLSNGSSKP